ncbi:hypothetical protein QOZ80_8BG0653910 [Eleusine coracana subsp. coracana]|nr:hypothetical protein QOZ80_8BG0653910 [Eleusine coracana subsp. coracana]
MAPKRTHQSSKAQTQKQSSPEKGEEEGTVFDIPAAIKEFPMSAMDSEKINRLVIDGVLQDQQTGGWIEAIGQKFPQPPVDQITVFFSFFYRGYGIPCCDFFHGLLFFYGINFVNLNPNSILHIAIFIHLCKVFLGIHPHFDTFKELFVLKSNNNNVIGGAGFQLRNKSKYIDVPLPSTNKGWHADWFYHGNHAPPLSETTIEAPKPRPEWSAKAHPNKKSQVDAILEQIAYLKSQGYTGVHVAASFIYRRVQSIKKRHVPGWKFQLGSDPTMEVPEILSERKLTLRLENIFSSLLGWTPGSAKSGHHSKTGRSSVSYPLLCLKSQHFMHYVQQ